MPVHVTTNTELITQYKVDFEESERQGRTVYIEHDGQRISVPGVRNCDVRHYERNCPDLRRSAPGEISFNTRNTKELRERTGGDRTGRHSECWNRYYEEERRKANRRP
jgi:hypothetical protein